MPLVRRLRTFAIAWIAVAWLAYAVDLLRQTRAGLTNGALRPFGDDFINYWSAAYLAWHGRAAEIYDWNAFHAFETGIAGAPIDFYHYSYPPVLLVLTAPLAVMPYVPALFAWLIAGWLSFYAALRAAWPGRDGLLLALATPAVFINAVGGQNGTWTAALLGGGLTLLNRRPVIAGILFGLLIYKPQLGILLPVALLAGRQFRAVAAAGATAVALALASALLVGTEIWSAYLDNATVLRRIVLEDPTGVWHRMLSVFITARQLGAGVTAAYVAQAAVALVVDAIVAIGWARDIPPAAKNVLLVLGTCLATPYVQDYDLVIGAFVAVWLAALYPEGEMPAPMLIGAGLILAVPFLASLLAKQTGLEWGPLFIVPAFVIAARPALKRASGE
jgi:hypothetical protein